MKKLSFGLVALLAIVFAVSSAFTSRNGTTQYFVYGAPEELTLVASNLWDATYDDEVIDEQIAADINPESEDASPFDEPQLLSDFELSCLTSPNRVCLLSVEKTDGIVTDIIDVKPGQFDGF